MTRDEIDLQQSDDMDLPVEVSDQALEAAAGLLEGEAKSQTISFCSGLDTCPS